MPTPPNPPTGVDLDDDPLLPWIVAAKGGDRGAERELLLRLAPLTLEVARQVLPENSRDHSRLALQGLLLALRALPSLRGEERTCDAVAKLTWQAARNLGSELHAEEADVINLARESERAGAKRRDQRLIEELVEQAFKDDSSILVSQIMLKPRERKPSSVVRWLLAVLGLVLAAALGYAVGLIRHR